jgi:hypothetical protein
MSHIKSHPKGNGAASKSVKKGSRAKNKASREQRDMSTSSKPLWLKAMEGESMTGQLTWEKIPFPTPPTPRHKPPKPAPPTPKHKPPKPKGKSYNIGGLISGALGTPPGAAPVPQGTSLGQGTSPGQGTPKKGPSPAAVQDALLKKKADEKKRIDLAGKPGMSKDASKNVGEGSIAKYKQHLTTPPKMARKGGKISMRDGGSVSKNYSNTYKTDLTVDV